MGPDANYSLSPEDATLLLGALHMPAEERAAAIQRLLSPEDAKRMLAGFIGLAASVYENVRAFAETEIVVETTHDPNFVEKWNFPDLTGALIGVSLAAKVDQTSTEMCSGCAFRLGTHANHSSTTTADAMGCLENGEAPFMCHDHMDGTEPTRACAGWKIAKRAAVNDQRKQGG